MRRFVCVVLLAGFTGCARVDVEAEKTALMATDREWSQTSKDLDKFITAMQRLPLRVGGHRIFSAHQMSSCRMGTDPATSVANPSGELHDTPGVYIGDASAMPSASGVNPMISPMALAHRTAQAIAARASAARPPVHA